MSAEPANSERSGDGRNGEPRPSLFRRVLGAFAPAIWGPPAQRYEHHIPDPENVAEIRVWLQNRQLALRQLLASLRLWRVVFLVLAFVIAVISWQAAIFSPEDRVRPITAGLVGLIDLSLLIGFVLTRARIQDLKSDLQIIEYEILLLSLRNVTQRAAANLFFKHQFELKRYYDQNLRQSSQVFVLGVLLSIVGLGAVAGAAVLIATGSADGTTAQITTAGLGAVGAALAGGVARVYLSMQADTASSLREFHNKLATTNRLHLANLFASTLDDAERSNLTAVLVRSIAHDAERDERQRAPEQ